MDLVTTRDAAASRQASGGNLLDHIKNLKIKRYIDIWYVTYRNLHFFERPDEGGFDRPSTSTATAPPLGGGAPGTAPVEASRVPPSGGPATPPSPGDEVAALRVPPKGGPGDQAPSMASRNS